MFGIERVNQSAEHIVAALVRRALVEQAADNAAEIHFLQIDVHAGAAQLLGAGSVQVADFAGLGRRHHNDFLTLVAGLRQSPLDGGIVARAAQHLDADIGGEWRAGAEQTDIIPPVAAVTAGDRRHRLGLTTERTLECFLGGTVSSVSGMVFMEDSERSAAIAQERGIDVGLHLNLTSPFSFPGTATRLREQQQRISKFLRRHRFAPAIFHPGLRPAFEYVVAAQLDEFRRLYGADPIRIDGHHHMHLAANVLLGKLLPSGTVVRRNFSFERGEKSWANRLYRRVQDNVLSRRHRLPDFLFPLAPLDPRARLRRVFSLAKQGVVEVETHPINRDEYRFLTEGEILRLTEGVPIAIVSRPR
jgi:chitin disaccharide deacetylase